MPEEYQEDDKTRTYIVLTKGTMVSHYRIVSKIGAGGMGEVYLAEDTQLDRKVALKFLPPHLCQDEDCRKRFKREAQAVAKLNHPNIITIHEVAEYQGRPFFAMELVEGQSLGELSKGKALDFDRIVELAIQICDGLAAAHDKKVVHRDIKPSNIVIDAYGRPKILDFGLAAIPGGEHLTKTGSTLGTVRYMSPEQAQGKEVDQRSDLFSLGIVLYEMIAGRTPFERDNEAATLKSIAEDNPEPLARYKSDIPDELQRTVSKLLEKDPSLRYQHADGVVSDLKRMITPTQSSIAVSPVRLPTRWLLLAGVGVVAIVVAAVAWYSFWPKEKAAVSKGRKMLAVLPFENLGSPEDEYFADGITDEIMARLAGISQLGVIARTSIIQYKGTDKPVAQIGEELGVDYILEGTVRWQKSPDSPGRVRVTPQLIRVSDATHEWAEVYDKVLAEVFEVQTDIATQIVEALDVALAEPERRILERKPTDNLKAYDYYLQGNDYFDPEAYTDDKVLKLAARLYQQAIDLDSGFALAYAKLSRVNTELYWHHDRPEEDLVRAKRAVDKAMELDPDLPEAHTALGSFYYHRHDYDRALEEFEIAWQRQPNNTILLLEIGHARRRQGQPDSAIAAYARAVELDPRSVPAIFQLGLTYNWIRQYDRAEPLYDRAISLTPDWPLLYSLKAWLYLSRDGDPEAARRVLLEAPDMVEWKALYSAVRGLIYAAADDYDRALKEFAFEESDNPAGSYYNRAAVYGLMGNPELERLYYDSARIILEERIASGSDDADHHSNLGVAYAGLGRRDEAIREGKLAVELAPIPGDAFRNTFYVSNLARIYTIVGEHDAAIDQFETLLSVPGFVSVASMRANPFNRPLHDHPRFQALLEKYE